MANGLGTALLDFGAFPGKSDATIAVTGQTGISVTSKVEAWIAPDVTADHSEDEHMLEPLRVFVPKSSIIAGTGFTIYGICTQPSFGQNLAERFHKGRNINTPLLHGKFNIAYVWSD